MSVNESGIECAVCGDFNCERYVCGKCHDAAVEAAKTPQQAENSQKEGEKTALHPTRIVDILQSRGVKIPPESPLGKLFARYNERCLTCTSMIITTDFWTTMCSKCPHKENKRTPQGFCRARR